MIAPVPELPRNDQLAEQFELLADLMELEAADGFRISAYRKAAARIRETPSSVAQLALDGKAKQLEGIGITTAAALKAAAEAQQLRGHAGIGPGTEEKIVAALAQPRATEGPRRALLGTTLPKLRAVVEVLQEHPASVEVSLAGSARRMRETVRDLDIIATATDP